MRVTTKRPWPILLLAAALCVGLLPGASRAASSIMIWPLDPVIEDDQRAAAMWLENRGEQAVSMQVRVFGWTQANHEESYENQEAVIASPPLAVIPPGQRQLVRLMNTRSAADGTELAYRVLVDELPSPDSAAGNANQADGNAMGIKLQIRYSVPLFVSGKGVWTKPRADRRRDAGEPTQPVLRWRTEREGDAHYLVIRNTGAAHARLTAVQWVRGAELVPISAGLLGYVLPGAQMRWRLPAPPPPGALPQAIVNGGATPVQLGAQ